MNNIEILNIVLTCILTIANSCIVLKTSDYDVEIKELNVLFSCIFTLYNIYIIYKYKIPIEDDFDYFNAKDEPEEYPPEENIYIHQIENFEVPTDSFLIENI